jgi:hypothetical protein
MAPPSPRSIENPPSRPSYNIALAAFERDTIRSVAEEMRGQDVHRVRAVLISRFRARLPDAELDERNLHKLAAAIARGGAFSI